MTDSKPENDQPAARPDRKRGRGRMRRIAIWLVILIFLSGAAAVLFRLELINRFAPRLLTDTLAVPTHVTLTTLDWRQTRIDEIRLGDHGALAIDGITLAYNPWNAQLERVEIDRVALAARYDENFSLGELDPLLARLQDLFGSGENDTDAGLPELPTIIVKAIEIDLQSPAGPLTGRGQATIENQAVIAQFNLTEQDGHAEIGIDLALSLAEDGGPPSGSLRMGVDAASALWRIAGLPQPLEGRLGLEADIRTDENWRKAGRIDANWHLEAANFALSQMAAPISGHLRATSAINALAATVHGIEAEFTGGIAPEWVSKLKGELDLQYGSLQRAVTGQLSVAGAGPRLSLAEFGAADIVLTKPDVSLMALITGNAGPDNALSLDLAFAEPATLSVASAEIGGTMHVPQPVKLTFAQQDTPFLHLAQAAEGTLAAEAILALGKTTLTLEPKALGERLILAMPGVDITAHYASSADTGEAVMAAHVETKKAQIAVPLRGVTLGNVATSATWDGKKLVAKLSSGALTGLGAFVPVRADIDAALTGNKVAFGARFRGIDQPIDLVLDGTADMAKKSGEIMVKLAPIDFMAGGQQPYNFFPPLRGYFDGVSGRITAEGPVRFKGGDLTSDLRLGIENFSGKVGPVDLRNVNTVVEIDKPWPLSTKPDQAVAIALADVGLPLSDAIFRFKVSNGKRLEVAESRLRMSGGEIHMDPVTLDLDAPVHNLRLTMKHVSVSQLFENLGVAGLSGEGSISGVVPVSIFPGGIAIPPAELRADGPGILRYRQEQAPLAVQSAGETLAMALQALSDFHYKELILTLTRALTGDVNLGLHISGSNPSFYDGYPVEFNLSVEGRLDQALREGLAGYQVPDMIQEQLQNLTP